MLNNPIYRGTVRHSELKVGQSFTYTYPSSWSLAYEKVSEFGTPNDPESIVLSFTSNTPIKGIYNPYNSHEEDEIIMAPMTLIITKKEKQYGTANIFHVIPQENDFKEIKIINLEDINFTNKQLNNIFNKIISKHGAILVQYFALLSMGGTTNKKFDWLENQICSISGNEEFAGEYLTTCWYGGDFFKWIIPYDSNNEFNIDRPKTAIGPYNYENTSKLYNNTIVHGYAEGGGEDHYFFIICFDNIATIYNTYGGQDKIYVNKHNINNANKTIEILATESKTTMYSKVASKFFGYLHIKNYDDVYKFELIHHPFWLPSPNLIQDYFNILKTKLSNIQDKINIDKIIYDLKQFSVIQ